MFIYKRMNIQYIQLSYLYLQRLQKNSKIQKQLEQYSINTNSQNFEYLCQIYLKTTINSEDRQKLITQINEYYNSSDKVKEWIKSVMNDIIKGKITISWCLDKLIKRKEYLRRRIKYKNTMYISKDEYLQHNISNTEFCIIYGWRDKYDIIHHSDSWMKTE